jgi:hypothetical protein
MAVFRFYNRIKPGRYVAEEFPDCSNTSTFLNALAPPQSTGGVSDPLFFPLYFFFHPHSTAHRMPKSLPHQSMSRGDEYLTKLISRSGKNLSLQNRWKRALPEHICVCKDRPVQRLLRAAWGIKFSPLHTLSSLSLCILQIENHSTRWSVWGRPKFLKQGEKVLMIGKRVHLRSG